MELTNRQNRINNIVVLNIFFMQILFDAMTDEELIPYINQRNESAFTELHDRYKMPMLVRLRVKGIDASDAQNIVQEIFKNLWSRCESLKIDGAVKVYIYGIVSIKILDHYRNQGREVTRKAKLLGHTDAYAATEQPEESDYEEKIRRLYAAIERLPGRFRRYMELWLQEKSIANIAAECGVQPQTVSNMLNGGRKKLRIMLCT